MTVPYACGSLRQQAVASAAVRTVIRRRHGTADDRSHEGGPQWERQGEKQRILGRGWFFCVAKPVKTRLAY